MKFDKTALSFEDQLGLLEARGLKIEDSDRAKHYLSHLNYFRLAAYWLPFELSGPPDKFKDNTTFDQILNHYIFDREFRLLLLDAIERIEVSFRTQWAYQISHKYGPHGYLLNNNSIRKSEGHLHSSISYLQKEINRSDEEFVKHYKDKYDEELPPAWVSCELMSLGLLSRFYGNLKAWDVRRNIAKTYDLDESFLEGFMEHLTYVRNLCAHHSRLWNRHLIKKMPLPKNKPAGLAKNIYIDSANKTEHKIYNTLVLMVHLIQIISPHSNWKERIISLIDGHQIDSARMGFPANWKSLSIWKE